MEKRVKNTERQSQCKVRDCGLYRKGLTGHSLVHFHGMVPLAASFIASRRSVSLFQRRFTALHEFQSLFERTRGPSFLKGKWRHFTEAGCAKERIEARISGTPRASAAADILAIACLCLCVIASAVDVGCLFPVASQSDLSFQREESTTMIFRRFDLALSEALFVFDALDVTSTRELREAEANRRDRTFARAITRCRRRRQGSGLHRPQIG